MRRVMRWLEVFVSCVVQDGEFSQDGDPLVLEDMVNCLFLPWESPVKSANKKLFVFNGGLDLTIQLHKYLLSYQWEQLPGRLKLMEGQVLWVLWALSEDVTFRQIVFNKGGLQDCKMSLLRVPILPNQPIVDKSTPDDNYILATVERAIAFLSWMCEISSCHMELATDTNVLTQLSNVVHCPSIDEETVLDIVSIWLTLAHTTETHSYLVEAGLVDSFLARPNIGETENSNELKVLYQYHGAVFLAQMILVSLLLIAEKKKDIDLFLTNFIQEAQPSEIAKMNYYQENNLLPYIKLVYLPDSQFSGSDVYSAALQTIIIALHILLARDFHRDVLIREGLMDYITCMPWYTTGAAEQRARALVKMVQQAPDVDLQPPSLLNIAKAFMSKKLQTVVHLSVPEILQIVHY